MGKKLFLSEDKSWWTSVHGRFLKDHLESFITFIGQIAITSLENTLQENRKKGQPPPLKSTVVVPHKRKEPPYEEVQKDKILAQTHQASNKQPSQNESSSSRGDVVWGN